jgi:membrane associated rhomboid family serine protease
MPVGSNIVTLDSISRRRILFKMARPLPLFTALIMVSCTAVFVFQLTGLAPSPSSVCLRPVSIFPNFQLYRIFMDPFFHGGFLHIGLNLFSFYILGSDFENQLGTLGAAYVISLIMIPFSGIIHTALAYLFDALSGMSTRYNCASKFQTPARPEPVLFCFS